jgi:hypothetical protein
MRKTEELDVDGTGILGNRDFEQLFFKLKNSLVYLSLGDYIDDETLVFIVNICTKLEKLTVISRQVTNGSVT